MVIIFHLQECYNKLYWISILFHTTLQYSVRYFIENGNKTCLKLAFLDCHRFKMFSMKSLWLQTLIMNYIDSITTNKKHHTVLWKQLMMNKMNIDSTHAQTHLASEYKRVRKRSKLRCVFEYRNWSTEFCCTISMKWG